MVIVIDDGNAARCGDLLEKVYRFRHRVFVEGLSWQACRRPDGREIDLFDGPGCVHLVRLEGEAVTGYSRLLPTTRPHLLSDVYPHLAQVGPPPRGPRVYEWTRFGTLPAPRERRAGRADRGGDQAGDLASAAILTAAAEVAQARGLEGLLVQVHPILVNRLMSCGWDVAPLGLPTRYRGHPIVAVYARLTEDTVAASRRVFGLERSPLAAQDVSFPFPAVPRPRAARGAEIRLRA